MTYLFNLGFLFFIIGITIIAGLVAVIAIKAVSEKEKKPAKKSTPTKEGVPILAKIVSQDDLGKIEWYEVIIYHDGWHRIAPNKPFAKNEQVLEWQYCFELF